MDRRYEIVDTGQMCGDDLNVWVLCLCMDYEYKLEMELRSLGFSRQTIKTYMQGFKAFLHFINKDLRYVKTEDFKRFKIHLLSGLKPKTVNTYLAPVKFFYMNIMKRKMHIKGVKNPKKLPVVHSRETIVKMIESCSNPKHKLLMILLYSSGLRVSEVVRLKWEDIDFHEKIINIRGAKGKKDRITLLSEKSIEQFKNHYKVSDYLFPGRKGHLTERTAQAVIKNYSGKKLFPHSLRSSFATHLLDNGEQISSISKLLGHENLQTTQIYTKVSRRSISKIISPLD